VNILHTEWMGVIGGQTNRVMDDLLIAREIGARVTLACKRGSYLQHAAFKNRINTYEVPFKYLLDPISFLQLIRIITKENIDIVNTHSSKDSYVATLAAKFLGKKIIRSRHMMLTKRPGFIYKAADTIIVTGEAIKKEMEENGISKDKVFSIPSYPDENRFYHSEEKRKYYRERHNILGNDVIVGTMIGFNTRKRPKFFMRIAKSIVHIYKNVKFLLAGAGDTALKEDMTRYVESNGLSQNVAFPGYIDDPETFLNALDIYICPSGNEGIPQSLMQAMMTGVACISSDVGSIADLNIENNLLIVPKDNINQFIGYVSELVTNRDLRLSLGQLNMDISRQYFCRNMMKSLLSKIYDNLLK